MASLYSAKLNSKFSIVEMRNFLEYAHNSLISKKVKSKFHYAFWFFLAKQKEHYYHFLMALPFGSV
jgi:hypothetical protein